MEMAKAFQKYYSALYSVKPTGQYEIELEGMEMIQSYFKATRLPKWKGILEDVLQSLERPEEIEAAIKNKATGKSLGLNWYSLGYYKNFKGQLLPKFYSYVNLTWRDWYEEMRNELLLMYITIIPKEGKILRYVLVMEQYY